MTDHDTGAALHALAPADDSAALRAEYEALAAADPDAVGVIDRARPLSGQLLALSLDRGAELVVGHCTAAEQERWERLVEIVTTLGTSRGLPRARALDPGSGDETHPQGRAWNVPPATLATVVAVRPVDPPWRI